MIKVEQFKGTIHSIGPIEQVGRTEPFDKRVVVLKTYDTKYPQYLAVEAIKDKATTLNSFERNNPIVATLAFGGRLWTNPEGVEKCFNSIKLWDIAIDSGHEVTKKAQEVNATLDLVAGTEAAYVQKEKEEDLPF